MGASCPSSNTVPELFERLGGEQAVRSTIRIFYGKIVRDDRVSLFLDSGWEAQNAHWIRFLTVAFGGTNSFSSRELREIHSEVNDGNYPDMDQ